MTNLPTRKVMMESLAEKYYKQLNTEGISHGKLLYDMYRDMFDIGKFETDVQIKFHRLAKLYGGYYLYLALLDSYDVQFLEHTNIERLLSYFCKKRLTDDINSRTYLDLAKDLDRLEVSIEKLKAKKRTFKSPFDEEEDGIGSDV